MKKQQETFANLMDSFSYRYDLRPVFDDFLTMTMCAVTQIPCAEKSHYEDLYLETIAKYKDDDLRFQFPKLFAQLIVEMEERLDDGQGNDVLGEYYELNFCRKNSGQYFTPWPICQFMAKAICGNEANTADIQRIIDPTCGSGRMILAAAKNMGWRHEYDGIDLDHTCVKMTAINLFLNGVFHCEVMCANALNPDDFGMSYRLSFLPLGIFMIVDKESSRLWNMHKNSFEKKQESVRSTVVPSPFIADDFNQKVSQITLF
jgi:type I restriction-modification system DNA methylase subunit